MRKQGKVYDETEYPRKAMNNNKTLHENDVVVRKDALPTRLPKPVDEDLYKISPELLRKTKRVRFFFVFLQLNVVKRVIRDVIIYCLCRRKCWVSFPCVLCLLPVFHDQLIRLPTYVKQVLFSSLVSCWLCYTGFLVHSDAS